MDILALQAVGQLIHVSLAVNACTSIQKRLHVLLMVGYSLANAKCKMQSSLQMQRTGDQYTARMRVPASSLPPCAGLILKQSRHGDAELTWPIVIDVFVL